LDVFRLVGADRGGTHCNGFCTGVVNAAEGLVVRTSAFAGTLVQGPGTVPVGALERLGEGTAEVGRTFHSADAVHAAGHEVVTDLLQVLRAGRGVRGADARATSVGTGGVLAGLEVRAVGGLLPA